jgi:CDP-diacylglycerol--glycerol-3-phosphate 3-phosphatidyltransferase
MKIRFNIPLLPKTLQIHFLAILAPFIQLLVRYQLNPNTFTTLGLIFTLAAALALAFGYFFWGGVLILLGGLCDVIDGQLARAEKRVTKFGALYDSTLDRYGEVLMFFGVAYHFVRQDDLWTTLGVCIALGGSIMVSYIRARAEGLGLECKVGMMQRPERIFYMGLGAMIGETVLTYVIWIIAIFANLTALYRLNHVWKSTREGQE